MNYDEMSDEEVTLLVCKNLNIVTWCFGDYVYKDKHCDETIDYCNEPSDWGNLLEDNNMDIIKIKTGEHKGKWSCRLSQKAISVDIKIGRAIAICYLKQKEAYGG